MVYQETKRKKMNLLEVLAVANGTLYLLRSATLRRECVQVGRELRRQILSSQFFLGKEQLLQALLDGLNTIFRVLSLIILHPSQKPLKTLIQPNNIVLWYSIPLYQETSQNSLKTSFKPAHLNSQNILCSLTSPLNNHSLFGRVLSLCDAMQLPVIKLSILCLATFFENNTFLLNNRFFFCYL